MPVTGPAFPWVCGAKTPLTGDSGLAQTQGEGSR